jgi:hypothetical protein
MSKKYWIYLSAFLFTCLIILKYHFSGTDISLYPIKNSPKTYKTEKTWLISYANQAVHIQNQSNLVMSAAMYQAFDVIMSYQPHHIEPAYHEKHKNILVQTRGGGYWLWKPYFIAKTLAMMAENDVLLYLDSSAVFRDGIYKLLELGKQHDMILFPNFHANRGMVKKLVLDKMVNGDESYLDKVQLDGSILLLRNTAHTRALVEEWLQFCQDEELLTDLPSKNEYPDFKDHRHDQAILSILYHKNPTKYFLYDDYPARMEVAIVTRRKNQCSMLPITYGSKTKFDWLDGVKYRSIIWLIGCKRFKGS